MMERLKTLREILPYVMHPIDWLLFTAVSLRDFALRGGVEIDTSFEYQRGSTGETHWFRTVIQLDADIINTVPEPDLYRDDLAWRGAFDKAYRVHRERVGQLGARLGGIGVMAWMGGAVVGLFPTLFLWHLGPSDVKVYGLQWAYSIVWLITAYLVRRYAVKGFLALVIKIAKGRLMGNMFPGRQQV
jgi:hypothetical protein